MCSYNIDPQVEQEWQINHAYKYEVNFKGSAPSMETEGVKRIFQRSGQKHKLRYTEYYGDGDSKGFSGVENTYIEKGLKVAKKKCVGHVQEACGDSLKETEKGKERYGW